MSRTKNQRWKIYAILVVIAALTSLTITYLRQANSNTVQRQTENSLPKGGNLSDSSVANSDNWDEFHSPELKFSFKYPSEWNLSQSVIEGIQEISLSDRQFQIFITSVPNPDQLTPKEWFRKNRKQYNDLFVEIAESKIQGSPTVFVGVPNTCLSSPGIVVIIGYHQNVLLVHHFEKAERINAEEVGVLLETLAFDKQEYAQQTIPSEYTQIPEAPTAISCS